MGRAARAPGHAKRVTPLHRKTGVISERMFGLPGPRNDLGLMVFARNPAKGRTSGPGIA